MDGCRRAWRGRRGRRREDARPRPLDRPLAERSSTWPTCSGGASSPSAKAIAASRSIFANATPAASRSPCRDSSGWPVLRRRRAPRRRWGRRAPCAPRPIAGSEECEIDAVRNHPLAERGRLEHGSSSAIEQPVRRGDHVHLERLLELTLPAPVLRRPVDAQRRVRMEMRAVPQPVSQPSESSVYAQWPVYVHSSCRVSTVVAAAASPGSARRSK